MSVPRRVAAPAPVLAALFLGLTLGQPLGAQETPGLFLVATGDSVRILLPDPGAGHQGFFVYRGTPGGTLERITPAPVRPVRDPAGARAVLGDQLPMVMRALRAADEGEVLQRLRGDDFTANVLSFLSDRVARVLGRYHVDTGLTPGSEYEYRVVLADAWGEETDRFRQGRVRITDIVPPAPGRLSAEARPDGTVALEWSHPPYTGDPADLVVGFHLYRAAGSEAEVRITETPVLRNDAAPPVFVDQGAREGAQNRYRVRAVDLAGREGPAGDPVSVTPADTRPPGIVAGLRAEAGESRVRLTWRMSPELDVVGYHVERSVGLDRPYERITPQPVPVRQPAWSDDTVTGGVQYFFRVVAVDARGNESAPSNAVDAVPVDRTPPAPPTNLTAEPVERNLVIDWTPSPSPDVQGYYVYRGGAGDRPVRLVERPVDAARFVDTGYEGAGLAPGRSYRVTVTAVDRSWNESEAATVEVTVPDDQPPGAPTGFRARNVEGRYVELAWAASPSLDVMEYVVSRGVEPAAGVAPSDPEEVLRIPAHAPRSARDTTVVLAESYEYRLVAVDTAGNRSEPAVDRIHFRDLTPPPSPRHAAVRSVEGGLEVRWERVASRDLAGYHVYRSLLPTGSFERITDAPVTELRHLDEGGRAEHYYVVRAVDRSGNESAPSPAVRVRP